MDTQKGMTIKEIAEIANVDESTICRWIQKGTSAFCRSASAKCNTARSSGITARLNLAEILDIFRSAGKSTLADLLESNVVDQMQTQNTTATVNNAIIPAALIGRVYMLFSNCKIEMSVINRIMDYATTRSQLTGKYLSVKDITLLLGADCSYSENYLSKKINAVRRIMEDAKMLSGHSPGFLPAPGIDMIELEGQHV